HQIDARIPVVLVTVVRSADAAIEAMRQGAYDYLLKPLDLQKLDRVIGEAVKVARLMREPAVGVGTPPAGGAHPLRREGPAAAVREVPDGLPDRGGQGVLRPAGGPRRPPGRRSLSRGRRPRRDLPGLVPQGGEGPGAEVTAGMWGDGSQLFIPEGMPCRRATPRPCGRGTSRAARGRSAWGAGPTAGPTPSSPPSSPAAGPTPRS